MADEVAVEEDDTKDGAVDKVGADVKELVAGVVVGAVDQEAIEEVVSQGSPIGVP